jgi:uncharacterized membrane protein YfcA
MKKMLAIIVGLVTGTSVMLLFGYPLTQALVTGSCAMIGMYIGQFLSKRRAEKKAQKKEINLLFLQRQLRFIQPNQLYFGCFL